MPKVGRTPFPRDTRVQFHGHPQPVGAAREQMLFNVPNFYRAGLQNASNPPSEIRIHGPSCDTRQLVSMSVSVFYLSHSQTNLQRNPPTSSSNVCFPRKIILQAT